MSRKKSRRTRGSDGRLYDRKKQADRGHQAHESRVETKARRARWRGEEAYNRALRLFFAGLTFLFVDVPMGVLRLLGNGLRTVAGVLSRSSNSSRGRR